MKPATQAVPAPSHERPKPLAPEEVRLRWTETGARLVRDDGEVPVRVVWARPLTARGQELSIIDERKREHAFVPSLDLLAAEVRAVAERALDDAYLIARITRVLRTSIHLGTRYWEVETDRGPRRFAMREPRKNLHWLEARSRCLIRDTMGNRYEIAKLAELDPASRQAIEQVL